MAGYLDITYGLPIRFRTFLHWWFDQFDFCDSDFLFMLAVKWSWFITSSLRFYFTLINITWFCILNWWLRRHLLCHHGLLIIWTYSCSVLINSIVNLITSIGIIFYAFSFFESFIVFYMDLGQSKWRLFWIELFCIW